MSEGYCSQDGDCSHTWLDELLCEYVDGTMDPVVRTAFEEVLRRDADLADQVERLRCTRTLLCRHGCQMQAPHGLQTRMRQRLACELMRAQQPAWPVVVHRLGAAAMIASAMGVVLMLGMLAGMSLFADEQPSIAEQRPSVVSTGERIEQSHPIPSLHRAAMTPLVWHQRPMRRPWLMQHPQATLPVPSRTSYWLPATLSPQPAHLQRMNGAP